MLAITVVTINSLKADNVYAAEVANPQVQIKFYNTLIQNQKNVIIALNNKERTINKAQVLENNNNITDIVNTDKTSKEGTEIIKTGDIAKVRNDEYTIILYGDSNEDGTICDTDDVMTIVDDYLGKNKLNGINKIAANLENGDVLIDTDDIMKMIDAYIGTSNSIVSNIPAGELEIKTKTLAEIVQSGDYVDYPIQYNNVRTYYAPGKPEMHYGQMPSDKGWRVAYVDNGIVKLVTGGVPERINLNENTVTYLKTMSNFQKYIDSRYANTVIGALSVEEVDNYDMWWLEEYNPDDDDADFSNGGVLTVLFDDDWLVYHRDRVSAGGGIEVGTRPVVTLKQNLTAVSGDGTQENPYVLEVIEE